MATQQRWVTDKYIYVMLMVFPLFTGVSGYKQLTLSKYHFMLIATGIWLAILVFFSVRQRSLGFKPRAVHIVMLVFFAVCCLSAVFSPYGSKVLLGAGRHEGLVTIATYVLIFFGVSAYGKMSRGHVHALAISTGLTCTVAVIQLFGKDPLWLFPNGWCYYDAHTLYASEFLSTIGNTNLLSGFLCLSLPLMAAVLVTDEDKQSAWILFPFSIGVFVLTTAKVSGGMVGLAVCVLVAAPVIITDTRRLIRGIFVLSASVASAAMALAFTAKYKNGITTVSMVFGKIPLALFICAAAAAIFVLILIAAGDKISISRRTMRRSMCALSLGAVLFGILFIYFFPFSEGGTLYELSRVLHGEVRDTFGSSRIRIWKRALELVPEHFFLGGGPDTAVLRLNIHFARYVPETGQTLRTIADNAHNEYLGYLLNVGILGLSAYLAVMVITFAGWLKKNREKGFNPAIGCALVCYWAQGFFGLGLCIVAPIMWLLWGLIENSFKQMEIINEELKV